MQPRRFRISFMLLLAMASSAGAATAARGFAEATAGFDRCRLGALYVDEGSQVPQSPYLKALEPKRCDRDNVLATYCINEKFHGLTVTRLAVPKTTLPVFALYIDAPLEDARRALKRSMGSDFRASPESSQGARPELMEDPDDADRSVLICTRQF